MGPCGGREKDVIPANDGVAGWVTVPGLVTTVVALACQGEFAVFPVGWDWRGGLFVKEAQARRPG